MAFFCLFKNRIKNRLATSMNFVLLAIATTMLIYCVCNTIDEYGSFFQSEDSIICLSLDEAMPVVSISSKLSNYAEKQKIKYIDYLLDEELVLLHREYVGNDFLHNIVLNDKEYQVVLSSNYKKRYKYGDKFDFNGNEYVVVDFVDGDASYCSKKGIADRRVSTIAIEMTNIKTAEDKARATNFLDEIFTGANYEFGHGGELKIGNMLNANIFFALACMVIMLGFPFIDNVKAETKVFTVTGYTKRQIITLALCYQMVLSILCLGIGLVINAFISKTLGRNLLVIILFALSLVVLNILTVTIQMILQRRGTK